MIYRSANDSDSICATECWICWGTPVLRHEASYSRLNLSGADKGSLTLNRSSQEGRVNLAGGSAARVNDGASTHY